jgi:dienelactone hydrolase
MNKFIMIFLSILFATVCFAGCGKTESNNIDNPDGNKEETEINENQIYPERTNMVVDSQLYKDGDIQFPDSLWQTPDSERYEALDNGYAKGYFIQSVNNTWVFCFVGIPDTASVENKVPAVVLVHGGGGTAFYEWVNYWVSRGYAAIAMDTDGNMPTSESIVTNNIHAESIKTCGPENAAFGDFSKAIEEQWPYNGIAATIVSDSFLRSFEEVDTSRICITGISYGSFLTSQSVIYDDRYIGAVAVYGSLGQKNTTGWWGDLMQNESICALWDDASLLQNSKTPMLYISSSNDHSFNLESFLNAVPYSEYVQTCIKYNFSHSHYNGIYDTPECAVFIDNLCKKTKPLIQIKSFTKTEDFDGQVEVIIPKDITISKAEVYYTTAQSLTVNTFWFCGECEVENNIINYSVTGNTKMAFVNIIDNNNNIVSTNLIDFRK